MRNLRNLSGQQGLVGTTMRVHNRGFTLIELMIVVAIIGILSAVAYPSYKAYVVKGNRAAAQAFMMEVAQRQQNYLLNSRSYATSLTQLGYEADTLGGFSASSTVKQDVAPFYSLASSSTLGASNGSPPNFSLQLNPVAGSMQAGDGALCITNAGARTRFCGTASAESW